MRRKIEEGTIRQWLLFRLSLRSICDPLKYENFLRIWLPNFAHLFSSHLTTFSDPVGSNSINSAGLFWKWECLRLNDRDNTTKNRIEVQAIMPLLIWDCQIPSLHFYICSLLSFLSFLPKGSCCLLVAFWSETWRNSLNLTLAANLKRNRTYLRKSRCL